MKRLICQRKVRVWYSKLRLLSEESESKVQEGKRKIHQENGGTRNTFPGSVQAKTREGEVYYYATKGDIVLRGLKVDETSISAELLTEPVCSLT